MMRVWCMLGIAVLMTGSAKANTVHDDESAKEYLTKYYEDVNFDQNEILDEDGGDTYYILCIKAFQKMFHLPVTGELDNATKEVMNTPRCGCKDILFKSDGSRRKKRFALEGTRWVNCLPLTWKFRNYHPGMSTAEQDSIMEKAFKMWSDVTGLEFVKGTDRNDRCDLELIYFRGEHIDDTIFDGPGGILAHAFFPEDGGDIHFDFDENWTNQEFPGFDMLFVAVHEIGHSLGLLHTDIPEAVMYPLYKFIPGFSSLHPDDIAGAQAIYGESGTDLECCMESAVCCTFEAYAAGKNFEGQWTTQPRSVKLTNLSNSKIDDDPCRFQVRLVINSEYHIDWAAFSAGIHPSTHTRKHKRNITFNHVLGQIEERGHGVKHHVVPTPYNFVGDGFEIDVVSTSTGWRLTSPTCEYCFEYNLAGTNPVVRFCAGTYFDGDLEGVC